MLSMIRSNLTARRGRTLALLVGLLVATTSFVVLTGAAEQQRLDVVGTVEANARSAYDILVRPAGSRTAVEDSTELVQSSYLANTPSGITMDQYHQIADLPGVEVAAPVAVIGYLMPTMYINIDVTDVLTSATAQVLRISTTRTADGGLSTMDDQAEFLYVTRNETLWRAVPDRPGTVLFEIGPDGTAQPICDYTPSSDAPTVYPFTPGFRDQLACYSTDPRSTNWPIASGESISPAKFPPGHIIAQVGFTYPFLLAAIDPDAEARLSGLDSAMDGGRYLSTSDAPTYTDIGPNRGPMGQLPVIAADRPYVDDQLTVQVDHLDVDPATVAHATPQDYGGLETAPGKPAKTVTVDNSTELHTMVKAMDGIAIPLGQEYWRVGPVTYQQTGATSVAALPTTLSPDVWYSPSSTDWVWSIPAVAADTAFRPLTRVPAIVDQSNFQQFIYLNAVGSFDPAKVADKGPLGGAPLDTYAAPTLTAGAATLRPSANPAGYLQQPPMMLTTLAGLSLFSDASLFGDNAAVSPAPITAIRVRAAGVTGFDDVNRERVRLLAEQIHAATGLDVDIVIGSSLSPVSVSLPAGKFGRPALVAQEPWIHKGVAVAILQAVDRKSLALSVLILAVCALFAANASGAAVRARRSEFSVLAAVGWPPWSMFRLALGEMGLIGLVAGLAGALLAWPIGRLTDVAVSPLRAAMVIPAAVLLALAAGAIPAWRAAQTRPAQSLAAGTIAFRPRQRARMRRSAPTVTGLGLAGIRRVPSRMMLGVVSVAIGAAALTPVLAITTFFHGAVVGSVLGDAVAIQVRGSDLATVAAIIAMGVFALADVLYLNVRERIHEYTVLRVVGWPERALARLVVTEGIGIGVLGALLGAGLGLGVTAALVGGAWLSVALAAGAAAVASSLSAGLASLVPAALLRRLAPAPVLAEE